MKKKPEWIFLRIKRGNNHSCWLEGLVLLWSESSFPTESHGDQLRRVLSSLPALSPLAVCPFTSTSSPFNLTPGIYQVSPREPKPISLKALNHLTLCKFLLSWNSEGTCGGDSFDEQTSYFKSFLHIYSTFQGKKSHFCICFFCDLQSARE